MAHEQEFVAIRMRQTIDQYPLVFELLMDHVYLLPKFYADRLLETHACDRVPADSTPPSRCTTCRIRPRGIPGCKALSSAPIRSGIPGPRRPGRQSGMPWPRKCA